MCSAVDKETTTGFALWRPVTASRRRIEEAVDHGRHLCRRVPDVLVLVLGEGHAAVPVETVHRLHQAVLLSTAFSTSMCYRPASAFDLLEFPYAN